MLDRTGLRVMMHGNPGVWASWQTVINAALKQYRYSPQLPSDAETNAVAKSARYPDTGSGSMANRALSGDQIAFGRAVLLATDALGMSAEGAFWLYDRLDDQWQYFLVTSLAGRIGTSEIYLRLNDAFAKKLSEHEAQGFALFIADPNDGLVKDVGRSVSTEGYASQPTSISVTVGGKRARACIYRLSSRLKEDEARSTQRRFRRNSNELAAA